MKSAELKQRFSCRKSDKVTGGYIISYENFHQKYNLFTPYVEDYDLVDNIDDLSSLELIELRKRIIKNQGWNDQCKRSIVKL